MIMKRLAPPPLSPLPRRNQDVMAKNVSIYKSQASALEANASKNVKVGKQQQEEQQPEVILRGNKDDNTQIDKWM